MNDLDLMYLLDECDYEPSIENVKILRENEDIMEEFLYEARSEVKKMYADLNNDIDRGDTSSFIKKYTRLSKENPELYHRTTAHMLGKEASKEHAMARKSRNDEELKQHLMKKGELWRDGLYHKKEAKKYVKEEYSDYELYQILDECGYEPSIENVKILKENVSLVEDLMCEARGYIKRIARGTESGEDRAKFNSNRSGNERRLALHKTGKNIAATTAISGKKPSEDILQAQSTSLAGQINDANVSVTNGLSTDAVKAAYGMGAMSKKELRSISAAHDKVSDMNKKNGKRITASAQELEKSTGRTLRKLKKKQ